MDNMIGNPGSSTNITSDCTRESGIIMDANCDFCETDAQSSYSATIITPADSLIVAAAESFPRGTSEVSGGSAFGDRVSHLGSSISHMLTDFTHTITERAHETIDMISHKAHDISDAVTHADYKGMVDETRREISSNPEKTMAIAAGVGIALGLLSASRRNRS